LSWSSVIKSIMFGRLFVRAACPRKGTKAAKAPAHALFKKSRRFIENASLSFFLLFIRYSFGIDDKG